MSLPPERICIKRRREDEPVETLYIQSDIHQPKRRFTDYVFQRVVAREKEETASDDLLAGTSGSRNIQGNRAVSVFNPRTSSPGNTLNSSGIPIIATPSTRHQGLKAKQKPPKTPDREDNETTDKESARSDSPSLATLSNVPKVRSTNTNPRAGTASASSSSVRRFHLEAPKDEGGPSLCVDVLHRPGGGVQKNRYKKSSDYRPVIVEKLASNDTFGKLSAPTKESVEAQRDETSPLKLLEHAVGSSKSCVSKDGISFREDQGLKPLQFSQTSEADRGKSTVFQDPSTWDHDSEELANELSRIALEMTKDAMPSARIIPLKETAPVPQKRPLKYKPRVPKTHRNVMREDADAGDLAIVGLDNTTLSQEPSGQHDEERLIVSEMDEDSDTGYVFDEFIRRPVHDVLLDPDVQYFQNGKWVGGHEVPKGVGVVVITQGDSHFWDAIAEDEDEKDWDTEDEDSNAEDHPANEYPDEDLDFDDECDDNNAIYRRFRINGSDDEEYDAEDGSLYEYGARIDSRYDSSDPEE